MRSEAEVGSDPPVAPWQQLEDFSVLIWIQLNLGIEDLMNHLCPH